MLRRGWLVGGVLAGLGLLLVVGRVAAPAPSPAPPPTAPARPADLRPSCDQGDQGSQGSQGSQGGQGSSDRPPARAPARAPVDGPEQRPPVPGLRLDQAVPAVPRPGELPAARAAELARTIVPGGDGAIVHARLFSVTRPADHLRQARAWVVAVAGVPIGRGFCGSLGTREQVVVLDARNGHELLRFSYR
jgi:hypothetical protein